MAIEPINGRLHSTATNKNPVKTAEDNASATIKSKQGGERIELTTASDRIKKALEPAASEHVVDNQRVASIKQALTDGSYRIDPERIAQKISHFEFVNTETIP